MNTEGIKSLQGKMGEANYNKIADLNNEKLNNYVSKYVKLCNPDTVFVCTDDPKDAEYIRARAIELGEEKPLVTEGHTIHFDGNDGNGNSLSPGMYYCTLKAGFFYSSIKLLKAN